MYCSSRDFKEFQYPILLADIGGTNARFGLLKDTTTQIKLLISVPTGEFLNLESAIRSVLPDLNNISLKTAVFAIAAPIQGDKIPLINGNWEIEPKKIISELGLNTVIMLNDFAAQALALPFLKNEDLTPVGGGTAKANAPKCVIGPGTGLGMAALVYTTDCWIPIPSEGGHIEVGPSTEEEYKIWQSLPRFSGRIGAEIILSGKGILRIYNAIAKANNQPCILNSQSEITQAADSANNLAISTLNLFARTLGRVAGDQALMFLARGGVYITGGIPPKISKYLLNGEMRAAFDNKDPNSSILQQIPLFLIQHECPALLGLAAFAKAPSQFAVELSNHIWKATDPKLISQ